MSEVHEYRVRLQASERSYEDLCRGRLKGHVDVSKVRSERQGLRGNCATVRESKTVMADSGGS